MFKNKTITIEKQLLIDSLYCVEDMNSNKCILKLYYTNGDCEEYEVTRNFYETFTKHFVGF